MKILLDTSIWIEQNEEHAFAKVIQRLGPKFDIVTCPTIDQEIQDACGALAASDAAKADGLKSSYSLYPKQNTSEPLALELATAYLEWPKRSGCLQRR
jgi:predicted nucleic acid-binding protein